MTKRRILVTGASGCIGHYISETLIQKTGDELFLLVRDPAKLKIPTDTRAGVQVIQGDLQDLESLLELLPTITHAVLTATAWGGPEVVYRINVDQTLLLIKSLNPAICEQVIYFSTASILGREGKLLPEAKTLGTDYIRSKYLCFERLSQLQNCPPVLTIFPTLVVGGDRSKPLSHFSTGIPEVIKWAGLARFLKAEGSFHFIHAQDIAQVVQYLIAHPEKAPSQQLVLGARSLTVDEAVQQVGQFTGRTSPIQVNLSPFLVDVLVKVFQIQMEDWDRFCLEYRHFNYKDAVCPATFGLKNYCSTLLDVLKTAQG